MREGAVSPLLDDCTCTVLVLLLYTLPTNTPLYYCYYMLTTVTTAMYLHSYISIYISIYLTITIYVCMYLAGLFVVTAVHRGNFMRSTEFQLSHPVKGDRWVKLRRNLRKRRSKGLFFFPTRKVMFLDPPKQTI